MCYFHLQLTWLDWSRSRSRSFLVSVSVSISVSHSLVSVLALVSLCSGLINKPEWTSLQYVCVRYASPLSERYDRVPSQHCSETIRDDSMSCYKRDGMSRWNFVEGLYGTFRFQTKCWNANSDYSAHRAVLFVLIVLQNFQVDRWGSRRECKFGWKVKQEERQKEERIGHLQGDCF